MLKGIFGFIFGVITTILTLVCITLGYADQKKVDAMSKSAIDNIGK